MKILKKWQIPLNISKNVKKADYESEWKQQQVVQCFFASLDLQDDDWTRIMRHHADNHHIVLDLYLLWLVCKSFSNTIQILNNSSFIQA